jgi:hypothetical protein
VATGERGKGQHIVEIDPAKCLGRAGILAVVPRQQKAMSTGEGSVNLSSASNETGSQCVPERGRPVAAEQEEVVLRPSCRTSSLPIRPLAPAIRNRLMMISSGQ